MIRYNLSGTWRTVKNVYVRVSGAWRTVGQISVRTGGSWRGVWSYEWNVGGWSDCSAPCGQSIMVLPNCPNFSPFSVISAMPTRRLQPSEPLRRHSVFSF